MSRSRSLTTLLLAAAALATAPQVVHAQTCLGEPSLAVSKINLGVGAQFAEGAKGIGAGLRVGGASTFLGAAVSRVTFNDTDLDATSIDGTAGITITPTAGSSLQMCPFVGGGIGLGPDFTFDDGFDLYDVTTRTTGLNGGLALGGIVTLTPGLSVIPHVNGGVQYVRVKFSDGFDDVSDSETGGFVGGGLSLLFSEVFAIRANVSVPVGSDGGDPTFGIGFTVGWRR